MNAGRNLLLTEQEFVFPWSLWGSQLHWMLGKIKWPKLWSWVCQSSSALVSEHLGVGLRLASVRVEAESAPQVCSECRSKLWSKACGSTLELSFLWFFLERAQSQYSWSAHSTVSDWKKTMPLADQGFLWPWILVVPVTLGLGAVMVSSCLILDMLGHMGFALPRGAVEICT